MQAVLGQFLSLKTHVHNWGFPGGSVVKNSPANAGDMALSLDREDPLEHEMATHSSNPACKIAWTEEAGGLQSVG